MKNFLNYISMVPKIIELVSTVEKLVPLPGKGKEKLELVLKLVEQIGHDITEIPLEELKASVTRIVNDVVDFCNSTGVFKKS